MSTTAESERVPLLDALPELAEGLSGRQVMLASKALRVPVVAVRKDDGLPPGSFSVALLLIEGTVLRRVSIHGGRSVELLAPGSLLVPGREDFASFARSEWRAVDDSRLAVIDLGPESELTRWPSVCAGIAMRAIDRSRAFAVQGAIMSIVGVEDRLHALLWALAERGGRVTRAGVEVELGVPQEVLAEMVGARRPTVSLALRSLAERGLVVGLEPGRWLLKGEPPRLAS